MPTNNLDFSKMMFNVVDVPQGTDLCHKFPKLGSIKEFQMYPHPNRDRLIRYVMFMYDQNSPFAEQYPDLLMRKEACLDEAGFDKTKTGKYKDPAAQEAIEMANAEVNDMICAFLILQNNRVWSMIVSTEQTFNEYQRLILNPVLGKDDKDTLTAANIKSKLMEECDSMNERIEGYYKKLSNNEAEVEEVVIRKKKSTPEMIAKGGLA